MALFGSKAKGKKKTAKKGKQSSAAKAVLAKMKMKKNSGECAFC